ncbi:GDSL-like Lipase/Acylhydrolase [compost metagenome]
MNAIKIRQPEAKMLLMGLLPRRDLETRIAVLNKAIAKLAGLKNVVYLDTGKLLLDTNQKINEALFSDGIHPNTQGYDLLGRLIDSRLSKN